MPGVNKYWRVQVGTGMGLRCSGELSDCTFYKLAEEKFATCSEVQRAFGIIFYCRFNDEGFFIIDTPRAKLLEFCEQFKRKSAYFRIVFASAHPSFVHRTWPRAQAVRIQNRFSDTKAGRRTAMQFLESLKAVGIDTVTHQPYTSRKHADHINVLPRLILPYCVEWAAARIQSLLCRIFRSHAASCLGYMPNGTPIQVAWKLGGRHLVHELRSFHV